MSEVPGNVAEKILRVVDAVNRNDFLQFCQCLDADCIDYLAAIDCKDENFPTLLHKMVYLNRKEFVEEFLRRIQPPPPLCRNAHGETPLHLASKTSSDTSVLVTLISAYGVDESVNDNGETLLHYLLRNPTLSEGQLQDILRCVMCRKNELTLLNRANNDGATAFDFALMRHGADSGIVRRLMHYGGMSGSALLVTKRWSLSAQEESLRAKYQKNENTSWKSIMRAEKEDRRLVKRRIRAFENVQAKELRNRIYIENEACSHRGLLRKLGLQLQEIALRGQVILEEEKELAKNISWWEEELDAVYEALNKTLFGTLLVQSVGRGYLFRKMFSEKVKVFRRQKIVAKKIKDVEIIHAFIFSRMDANYVRKFRIAVQIIELFWRAVKAKEIAELNAQQRSYTERIQGITRLLTKLLWRENFCSAMVTAMLNARRKRDPQNVRRRKIGKINEMQRRLTKPLMAIQVLISVIELVYMGVIPRTSFESFHSSFDLVLISCEFLIALFLPLSYFTFLDAAVALSALIFCACKKANGSILITLYTLKIPFLVREFKKDHSESNSYCRAIENTGRYLLLLSPFFFAVSVGIIRYSARGYLLLSSGGNIGSILYYLWSRAASQLRVVSLFSLQSMPDENYPSALKYMKVSESSYLIPGSSLAGVNASTEVFSTCLPLGSIVTFRISVYLYFWLAALLGVFCSVKKHYEISDATKLNRTKGGFRSHQEAEPLDAHRAPNIDRLGEALTGPMLEYDVEIAKEAIASSFYMGRWQNITSSSSCRSSGCNGEARKTLSASSKNSTCDSCAPWSLTKENPGFSGACDRHTIGIALKKKERKGRLETIMERQLTSRFFQRESTYIISIMVIFSFIFPGNVAMEAVFGSALFVELCLTFYAVKLSVLRANAVPVLIRIGSCAVGIIPYAIPFAGLRALRLLESWSSFFQISGFFLWGLFYSFLLFIAMWMICFVSSLYFLAASNQGGGDNHSFCNSSANCLVKSLYVISVSSWADFDTSSDEEGVVMIFISLLFQLIAVPFFLAILLHPLLKISSFLDRFLRLVIQALQNDLLEYLRHFLEGDEWYTHWRFYEPFSLLSPNIMASLKRLASSVFIRRWKLRFGCLAGETRRKQQHVSQSFVGLPILTEIISSNQFAPLKQNLLPSKHFSNARLCLIHLRRSACIYWINICFTICSFVLLFVVNPLYSSTALITLAIVVHFLSILLDVFRVRIDFTASITLISIVSLLVSTCILIVKPTGLLELYEIRFVSLLRIMLYDLYPIARITFAWKLYIRSIGSILFPVLVIGISVMTAELLYAQISVLSSERYYDFSATFLSNSSQLTEQHDLSHASQSISNTVRSVFANGFRRDSFTLMGIFSTWIVPMVCVATCLGYLFTTSSSSMDINKLAIELVPLLEDPTNGTHCSSLQEYFNWVGNFSFVLSLIFSCFASPSLPGDAVPFLYFSVEIVCAILCLCNAFLLVRLGVFRCQTSKDYWTFPQKSVSSQVFIGEIFFLLEGLVEMFYYSIVLTLAISLIIEQSSCIVTLEAYPTYVVCFRFLFLLRFLPRLVLLSFFEHFFSFLYCVVVIVLWFCAATSAIVDVSVYRLDLVFSSALWGEAMRSFLRAVFLDSLPPSIGGVWEPFNSTKELEFLREVNSTYTVTSGSNFSLPLLILLLSIGGKVILASIAGFFIAVILPPISVLAAFKLPPKSKKLYTVLRGGVPLLEDYGRKHHDDLKPSTRREYQRAKFQRILSPHGISYWGIPHLLEELNICRPSRQRRFIFTLQQLLLYLPVSEQRRVLANEFVVELDAYLSGSQPTHLTYSALPVFPDDFLKPEMRSKNPYSPRREEDDGSFSATSHRTTQFIHPLRLIQAIAVFELSFPSDSSVTAMQWMEFISVSRKIRAATLFQSVWRMFKEITMLNAVRSPEECIWIANIRRSVRLQRLRESLKFRRFSTFTEAVRNDCCVFNPSSGHMDVLFRLNGVQGLLKNP